MKTSQDPRHLKRQTIIQELFAWKANPKSKITENKSKEIAKNLDEINSIITDCAPQWTIDKINPIDLAIMQLAVYELCIEIAQPPKVIIDEAVELAKEFGGESSSPFINGALGKALYHHGRILHLLANILGVEQKMLSRNANLIDDLNATELEVADIVSILEKDLHLPAPNVSQFQTVGNILEYVEEHQD